MAFISNYLEEYIKYDSTKESQPDAMPGTDRPVPEGTLLFDMATSALYVRSGSDWNEVSAAGGGGSDLPEVDSSDNGKVLGVVDGAWDKMNAPSGAEDYVINLDVTEMTLTAATFTVNPEIVTEEIEQAMDEGRRIILRLNILDPDWLAGDDSYVMDLSPSFFDSGSYHADDTEYTYKNVNFDWAYFYTNSGDPALCYWRFHVAYDFGAEKYDVTYDVRPLEVLPSNQ